jgi:radical SAM family uncharacterized protein/radical SAM-linked protein
MRDTAVYNISALLSGIEKPARYIGGELNSVVKHNAAVRMALCFPDLYEVGMSNAGVQVLLARVNALEGASCERVFAVAPDFEKRLREKTIPLFTLETRTPLYLLDLIGFNLAHELLYTGVLQVLDLGNIPLCRRERKESDPIILAGGECVSNFLPMEAFIDVFCIGDGEDVIEEIVHIVAESKEKGSSRRQKLESIAGIAGVFVPDITPEGSIVTKRIFRSKEPSWPTSPVVPSIRTAQDRAAVEITRGCANLCSFCHAGFYNLPYRTLKKDRIRDAIFDTIRNTGYDELTLASLSVSDYPFLVELLNDIVPWLTRRGVSVSLPSLRVDLETLPILEKLSPVRKSSLTFAVESASELIRQRSNKRLSVDDVREIVKRVYDMGWRLIKLYFMVGLPGCEEISEADDIVGLLKDLHQIGRRKLEINVTISPFVPKPHTPFEREAMQTREYFVEVIKRIKKGVPSHITIKSHDVDASILEGVLARGDEKLSGVILASFLAGCRFDSWSEYFQFDTWKRNLDEKIPGWGTYLSRRDEAYLPWKRIHTGFEKLIEARQSRTTALRPIRAKVRTQLDAEALQKAHEDFAAKFAVKARARVCFEKIGDARYIPHIDFIEIVKRALRMAEVPVSFTQGFNKRERIAAGFPVPLGVASRSELVDLDLYESAVATEINEIINRHLPLGIRALAWRMLASEEKVSLMALTAAVEYHVWANTEILARCAVKMVNKPELFKEGKSGTKHIPFDDAVVRWQRNDDALVLVLSTESDKSIRLDALLSQLCDGEAESFNFISMMKIQQYARKNGTLQPIL